MSVSRRARYKYFDALPLSRWQSIGQFLLPPWPSRPLSVSRRARHKSSDGLTLLLLVDLSIGTAATRFSTHTSVYTLGETLLPSPRYAAQATASHPSYQTNLALENSANSSQTADYTRHSTSWHASSSAGLEAINDFTSSRDHDSPNQHPEIVIPYKSEPKSTVHRFKDASPDLADNPLLKEIFRWVFPCGMLTWA